MWGRGDRSVILNVPGKKKPLGRDPTDGYTFIPGKRRGTISEGIL